MCKITKKTLASVTLFAVLFFCAEVKHVYAALPAKASVPQQANVQGKWGMEEASGTRADTSGNSNTLADNNTVEAVTPGIQENNATGAKAAHFELDFGEYLDIADGSQNGKEICSKVTNVGNRADRAHDWICAVPDEL